MNMGVAITAGPGMSGSGSIPVGMATGVHPGTVGSLGQGPGSGIGISSSSSLGATGMGPNTGAGVGGTMPPVDFMKVSCLIVLRTYTSFVLLFGWKKMAHIFNFSHFLLHNFSWLHYPASRILSCNLRANTIHHRCNVSAFC